MPQYLTYTKYYVPDDAQFLITLLQQHNIPYSFEHEVNQLDKVFIGESVESMFALKIPGDRFNDVNRILAEQAKTDMSQPGFEHNFQSYSPEELQEIIDDPENWNAYDLEVATTLLSKSTGGNNNVNPIKKDMLKMPVNLDRKWIILGYLACIAGLTTFFLIGAIGFFGGLAIVMATQTLKNGETVKMYSKQDRRHGRNMIVLSILCMATGAILF